MPGRAKQPWKPFWGLEPGDKKSTRSWETHHLPDLNVSNELPLPDHKAHEKPPREVSAHSELSASPGWAVPLTQGPPAGTLGQFAVAAVPCVVALSGQRKRAAQCHLPIPFEGVTGLTGRGKWGSRQSWEWNPAGQAHRAGRGGQRG